MRIEDFLEWKSRLSQGKVSKESRPLLANASVFQFRNDESLVYYRETLDETEYFKGADFLKRGIKREITESWVQTPPVKKARTRDPERKAGILKNLLPLMPLEKRGFWENLRLNLVF